MSDLRAKWLRAKDAARAAQSQPDSDIPLSTGSKALSGSLLRIAQDLGFDSQPESGQRRLVQSADGANVTLLGARPDEHGLHEFLSVHIIQRRNTPVTVMMETGKGDYAEGAFHKYKSSSMRTVNSLAEAKKSFTDWATGQAAKDKVGAAPQQIATPAVLNPAVS